jgi:hypothetical protein
MKGAGPMKFKVGDEVIHYSAPKDVLTVKAIDFHAGHGVHIYLVESLQTGEVDWVPEYELAYSDPTKNHRNKFKPGDIVTVNGYPGYWEVLSFLHDDVYEVVEANKNIAEMMYAVEEDMTLVEKPGPVEFQPKVGPKIQQKTFTTTKAHQKAEMDVLSRLDYNRQVAQRLKEWQDWFLDLYNLTNDPRYLRRVKRVQGWIEKVPTRAYKV